jgi:hypothetical protein
VYTFVLSQITRLNSAVRRGHQRPSIDIVNRSSLRRRNAERREAQKAMMK